MLTEVSILDMVGWLAKSSPLSGKDPHASFKSGSARKELESFSGLRSRKLSGRYASLEKREQRVLALPLSPLRHLLRDGFAQTQSCESTSASQQIPPTLW